MDLTEPLDAYRSATNWSSVPSLPDAWAHSTLMLAADALEHLAQIGC